MAKIFVIDDDPELLMMVGMILRRAGHETVLASDSAEGAERIISEQPDLLILDLMMPHMSGFEVCQKIRSTPIVENLPIMILTARIQEKDREAAYESGATDYMTKPITSRQLTSRVKRLLSQSL
ncbi:MAG TPA: response regulator [Gammaproteobacteria bacterium]|nr:response regulator [Gammaproteobacteria bacterium]